MSLAFQRPPKAAGNAPPTPVKRPSLAPEDYASMKLYYKQSYKLNLRQRLLGNLEEEGELPLSANESTSRKNRRQSSLNAALSKHDQQETRPFTKDMPIRAPSRSPKQMNINLNPHAGNKNMATSEIAKAAAVALDKRCPRMELPDLYCFHADFRPPVESAETTAERARQEEVDRHNRATVGRLRKMYQVAIAHSAATSRIASKAELASGLSPLSFNPYAIGELVSKTLDGAAAEQRVGRLSPAYRSFLDSANDEALVVYDHVAHADAAAEQESTIPLRSIRPIFTPIEEEAEVDSYRTRGTVGHRSDRGDAADGGGGAAEAKNGAAAAADDTAVQHVGAARPPPPPPPPLSLDISETAQRSKTVESKVMSQYWSNYLKAGQSKFARTSQQPTA